MSSCSVACENFVIWLSDLMRAEMCLSATQDSENDNLETEDMETCLCRTLKHFTLFGLSDAPTEHVSELERIKTILEASSGQAVSMSNWAKATQVDEKGELLRSARSLVLYITRNYRRLGVAFEDLVQAGNLGVLQGAKRFDQTWRYKFST
ncbi:hypothetical protein ACH5RR_039733 [Cinchona calisaya]|uniref:RNA polymerase sigma-70 region 2 domain-containing protein n=1 Tax=Cinchona calisaya TaxID=153742 RepID=A0ABD2Y365_9GENT